MSLPPAELLSFALGAIAIVLLPGANSLYVATTALSVGRRAGFRAMLGVFVGDFTLMTLAVLSAQALAQNPVIYTILVWAGAAYLLWIAFGLIRSAIRRIRAKLAGARTRLEEQPEESPIQPVTAPNPIIAKPKASPFRTALITSLLNPKAILFLASFFVQFIHPDSPTPLADVAVLMLILQVCSVTYLTVLTLVGAYIGKRVQAHGWAAIIGTLIAALAFIALAVRVVLP